MSRCLNLLIDFPHELDDFLEHFDSQIDEMLENKCQPFFYLQDG